MRKDKFKNKVVIVTGSSQGIGKATAIEFCRQGAFVMLNGRTLEKLEKTYHELLNQGYNVSACQGDITSEKDCQELIQNTISKYGRIDILINNASLTMNEMMIKLDFQTFSEVHNNNSLGAVLPTLTALPYLTKTQGSVVFISSLAGLQGMPSASAYSMGKMALTAFWQSLRIELAHTGVHFGICYVSFTQNEDKKRMMSSHGKLIPVPKRPSFIQQSREKVALSILSIVYKRQSKKILSPFGKILASLLKFFPRSIMGIMILAQKRNHQKSLKLAEVQPFK